MHKLSLTAVLLLAGTLLLPAAQTVHFGNFAPGTPLIIGRDGDFITNAQFSAVTFTVGAQALTIDSVDLGLGTLDVGAGFRLVVATTDLPTSSTVLTFANPVFTSSLYQRLTFVPDMALQLSANTPYWLRLEWDNSSNGVAWRVPDNTPDINSDYSTYYFQYGQYISRANQDLGAYYITATAIPEPSVAIYVLGGVLLAGLSTRFARRRQSSI